MLFSYPLTFGIAVALLCYSASANVVYEWYSDYGCSGESMGVLTVTFLTSSSVATGHPGCETNGANECCTPPYPPGVNSVYVSVTDAASAGTSCHSSAIQISHWFIVSWTMYANAFCENPVEALQRSSGPIPGTGCFNAAK